MQKSEPPEQVPPLFAFFNEIGIIAQLSRAAFEARMPPGMNLPQFSVLNHLVRVRDGQTPMALARAFQVPKTTMSHTLAALAGRELVRMAPNPEDGRGKLVWLTGAGRDMRAQCIANVAQNMAWLAKTVDMEEVLDMLPRLARLRAVMDASRDT